MGIKSAAWINAIRLRDCFLINIKPTPETWLGSKSYLAQRKDIQELLLPDWMITHQV